MRSGEAGSVGEKLQFAAETGFTLWDAKRRPTTSVVYRRNWKALSGWLRRKVSSWKPGDVVDVVLTMGAAEKSLSRRARQRQTRKLYSHASV